MSRINPMHWRPTVSGRAGAQILAFAKQEL